MHKVIVFTHGSLTESLVKTSRFILGSQPDIETYYVGPGYNLEGMRNGIRQSVRRSNDSDQGVLALTDLTYETSFSTMIQLEEECPFAHITSTNLPLLIKAVNRHLLNGGSRSSAELVDAAKEGIVDSHVPPQMN